MPSPPSARHSYSPSGAQQDDGGPMWLSRDPSLPLAGPCTEACGAGAPHTDLYLHEGSRPRAGEVVSVHWAFPSLALHARLARAWFKALVKEFWEDKDDDAVFQAVQVFAEIIANAIEHGGGGLVTVCLRVSADDLTCEIADGNPDAPHTVAATEDDEHHRGLALVCALLGGSPDVRPAGRGKVVGFSMGVGSRRHREGVR